MTTPICPICGNTNLGSRYHPYCSTACQRKAHPPRMTQPPPTPQRVEIPRRHGRDKRD